MQEKSTNTPVIQQATPSERFMNSVLANVAGNVGQPQVTNFQKKLIQNYFIKLDMALKAAEQKRMAKDEKYRDQLAFDWNNVNMSKLAIDVVAFSAIGMDPLQPNHINLIPYKNGSTNKYDINFTMGYRGLELKVKKYGFDVPDQIIVELIHANDQFHEIKKDMENPVEGYIFRIEDSFNRGEVIGGFYYYMFKENPGKNKLKVMSYADILKRRPDSAATEFWGGTKDEWKDGKKTGNKIDVSGWHEEMCYKTIARAAYNGISIDSEKIDEHLIDIIQRENDFVQQDKMIEVKAEIAENAGKKTIELKVDEPIKLTENAPPEEGNPKKVPF